MAGKGCGHCSVCVLVLCSCSSFPRTRESRAFRARTFEVRGFPPSRE
ncbi:hypothetical protein LG3211_2693 [Lysobacter gummosus]|nr:hypothetical protein LG3211_2693 [Lysobacter gummosus]